MKNSNLGKELICFLNEALEEIPYWEEVTEASIENGVLKVETESCTHTFAESYSFLSPENSELKKFLKKLKICLKNSEKPSKHQDDYEAGVCQGRIDELEDIINELEQILKK